MKRFVISSFITVIFVCLQSCFKEKNNEEERQEPMPIPYEYLIEWREDSMKIGNGTWEKLASGKILRWYIDGKDLEEKSTIMGEYKDQENFNADFVYMVDPGSIFLIRRSADSLYLVDEHDKYRTDIVGLLHLSPDSSLLLHNYSVSPNISIKYKLDRR